MEVRSKVLRSEESIRPVARSAPLRDDPQEGMNPMPFHLIHATGREGRGDRGRGCRSLDETMSGHRQPLEPVSAVRGSRVLAYLFRSPGPEAMGYCPLASGELRLCGFPKFHT